MVCSQVRVNDRRTLIEQLLTVLGVTYYITLWYRRHECGFRMAIFFSAATAAGAFGGLLARGIVELDGVGGKAGWAWIFIIEGLATFFIGSSSANEMHITSC